MENKTSHISSPNHSLSSASIGICKDEIHHHFCPGSSIEHCRCSRPGRSARLLGMCLQSDIQLCQMCHLLKKPLHRKPVLRVQFPRAAALISSASASPSPSWTMSPAASPINAPRLTKKVCSLPFPPCPIEYASAGLFQNDYA